MGSASSAGACTAWSSQFVGRIRVEPGLGPAEHEYLLAFTESRRWSRPGGPYVVPENPLAECTDPAVDLERYTVPAEGQPGLHCAWRPSEDGRGLVPNIDPVAGPPTSVDEVVAWLVYLRDHFLREDAYASVLPPEAGFGGFTFDHALVGVGAVFAADTGRLSVVRVRDSVVAVETVEEVWSAGEELAA